MHGKKNASGKINENGIKFVANPNNQLAHFLFIQVNGNHNANGNINGNGTEVVAVLILILN